MLARAAKVIEASLSAPPAVDKFVEFVQTLAAPKDAQPKADAVHGDMFKAPERPKGTEKTEQAALKCFLHWATACKNEGGDYQTLDEFLLAWARWVIKVEELFTDQAQMDECRQRRIRQAVPGVKVYSLPGLSFRTYSNAIMRLYGQHCMAAGLAAPWWAICEPPAAL